MGYDVKAWLSAKFLGTGKKGSQKGVSGYLKPKRITEKGLREADIPKAPRRGDTDGDYDTYAEDRNMEEEEVIHVHED